MKKKRKQKSLKNNQYNIHHLVNKCRGGADVEENKRVTKINLHNCLHALFGNLTPSESIKSLIDYFEPALMDGFRNDLLKVLNDWKGVEHKSNTYKGQRIKDGGIGDLLNKGTK